MRTSFIARAEELPQDPLWLGTQPWPVIAVSADGAPHNADVVVGDLASAQGLAQRIDSWPQAALVLVQVLRSTEQLPLAQALDMESLAYSTLQAGPEYAAWRAGRETLPAPVIHAGDPILLSRDGGLVQAVLNRPDTRNAMTVEMRDAWVEALRLLEADETITELRVRGRGGCFSVGGELNEFGLAPDPSTAHWVRSVHSPARLLAQLGSRVSCYLHGACIGSGIELPAFGGRVVAHSDAFFQLPELQFGLIPGAGGTVGMVRRMGRQRVAWMVLSGRRVTASTALQWGLVDELTDWC